MLKLMLHTVEDDKQNIKNNMMIYIFLLNPTLFTLRLRCNCGMNSQAEAPAYRRQGSAPHISAEDQQICQQLSHTMQR